MSGPAPEQLQAVAAAYKGCTDGRPRHAAARALGISVSHAGWLAQLARAAGLLPEFSTKARATRR